MTKRLAPAWLPGQSGNPAGRPIGVRNRLNEKFILALHDDFAKHGAAVIEEVGAKRPDVYLKVIASILPKEMHFKAETSFAGISDEQLDSILAETRRALASRAGTSSLEGEATSGSNDKLN
jgi:hypothetical protein